MSQSEKHIEALNEQKHTAKMMWLVVAVGMPVMLLFVLGSLIFAAGNAAFGFAFYGILAVVGLPLYYFIVRFFYKKYKAIEADTENPKIQTIRTTLSKLSRRYDDDAGIDYHVAKFKNGFSCHLKFGVAEKLTVKKEYVLTYFSLSKTIYEIKSADNKTIVNSNSISR